MIYPDPLQLTLRLLIPLIIGIITSVILNKTINHYWGGYMWFIYTHVPWLTGLILGLILIILYGTPFDETNRDISINESNLIANETCPMMQTYLINHVSNNSVFYSEIIHPHVQAVFDLKCETHIVNWNETK